MSQGKPLRLYPSREGAPDEAPGSVYSGIELPPGSPEPGRPYVYMNTVVSLDGRVSLLGKSRGIGSSADRQAMNNLRAAADAVMIGAGTLRAEKISFELPEHLVAHRISSGRSPLPKAVIVTRSGKVPLWNMVGTLPEVLVTSAEAVTPAKPLRVPLVGDRLELSRLLVILYRDHGVRNLLVEGGPTLNHQIVEEELADELFLTLSPRLLGGSDARTLMEGPVVPSYASSHKLHSIWLHQGDLFLRYHLSFR